MKSLIFLLLFFPSLLLAQHNISLEVHNVKTSSGTINVAVYDESEGFLKFDKVFKADSVMAKEGKTEMHITGLPEGEYALAIFHDENGNNKLDTNWLGMPKEAIGFSNARMKAFGPPQFKECAFRLRNNQKIEISL